MPARDPTHTYAGNCATTGLAWREPPMIGFERAGGTAANSGNRPPTAAITYPKLLMFEKSRIEPEKGTKWGFYGHDAPDDKAKLYLRHRIPDHMKKRGAQVRTSVRRIHFAIASGCPSKAEFALAHIYLQRAFGSA